MQRRSQIVVGTGRTRVAGNRFLERRGRLLIVAVLIESHSFGIERLRCETIATDLRAECERTKSG